MKKLMLMLLMVGCVLGLQAQQDAHYSQYMFNHLAINPAYAGTWDYLSSTFIYRKQWLNVDGAPTTQSFSLHGPSANMRNGYGLSFYNDQIGVTRMTTLSLAYAYKIPITANARLSFGLHGTVENMSNQLSGVRTGSTINGQAQDPSFNGDLNIWRPNVGFGAFFSNQHFYIGASAPDLLENDIALISGDSSATESRHYFIHSGFMTGDVDSDIRFKPSVLVKYLPNVPVSVDLNAQVLFRQKLWVGASYRTNDAIIGMIGMNIYPWLNLGYAYDYTISDLSTASSGSHEFMLGIDLYFKRSGMVSPRWF